MIDDWFCPVELPIAFSEFVRLPRHPAYKYEYFGGRAVLTPRPYTRYAMVELDVLASDSSPSSLPDSAVIHPLPDSAVIHPLRAGDWAQLLDLLVAAFRDAPPFGGLTDEARVKAARDCLDHTRAGGDGRLLDEACFIAGEGSERPAGAIVVTLRTPPDTAADEAARPHLTWVMMSPWRFRQRVGSAMLRRAATALRRLGYRELASTFLGGNERSAMWHWRNGFRLQPDPWSRRYRLAPADIPPSASSPDRSAQQSPLP
jgi:hypothetical protein